MASATLASKCYLLFGLRPKWRTESTSVESLYFILIYEISVIHLVIIFYFFKLAPSHSSPSPHVILVNGAVQYTYDLF